MSEAAPFRADLADGPEGGHARWLRAADGVRIRIGVWPGATSGAGRGTVILLPGRTECIEKYGPVARALQTEGWASLAIDWRGQGLSDRLASDPMLGHVGAFRDYQLDLSAALDWLATEGEALGLSGPRMMLAHSMGGLIGLRALYDEEGRGFAFRRAAFSAPMWGIRIPLWRQPMALALRMMRRPLSIDMDYAPTTSATPYLLSAPFEGNDLTHDRAAWDWLRHQLREEPGFRLGGPSIGWTRQALREARELLARPAPRLAAMAAVGTEEGIVLPKPIERRMKTWPGGRLDRMKGARHELLHEIPAIRERFLARVLAFFRAG